MPVDLDDPRLTAYALGELEDSSDIHEVEAYLEAHPEGRKFVAEICDTARVLGDRLRAEAPPASLTPAHKQAILGGLEDEVGPAKTPDTIAMNSRRPAIRPWVWGLAASALLVVTASFLLLPATYSARESARLTGSLAPLTAPESAALAYNESAPKSNAESSLFSSASREPRQQPLAPAEEGMPHLEGIDRAESPVALSRTETLSDNLSSLASAEGTALSSTDEKRQSGRGLNRPQLTTTAPATVSADGYDLALGQRHASGDYGYVAGDDVAGKPIAVPSSVPVNQPYFEQNQAVAGGYPDIKLGQVPQSPTGEVRFGAGTTSYAGMMGGQAQPGQPQPGSQQPQSGQQGQPGQQVQPPMAITPNGGPFPSGMNLAARPATIAPPRMGGISGGMGGMGMGAAPSGPTTAGRVDQSRARLAQKIDEAKDRAAAPSRESLARLEKVKELAALDTLPEAERDLKERLVEAEAGRRLQVEQEELARKKLAEVQLRQQVAQHQREQYSRVEDNPFKLVRDEPLSTFSIDVDTASYANVRRYLLQQSMLPPPDAVRIEEMVNYFSYDYPQPEGDDPFSVSVEIARAPWNADHRLARIGLKGREIEGERPASNIVFLIDVSGSMNNPDKLPLLKNGLRMLTNELTENDRVAIVVYASSQGTMLSPTTGDKKAQIMQVIDSLAPGGSTHGSAGIEAAYDMAARNFIPGGTNRVILCTDGDFNVGITDDGSLERFIAEKAKSKVFLTVLGFGTGNLQDAKMEGLADKGNGNYHYIDNEREARKVLVEELGQTLVTIAKDVKIQVDFNPAQVAAYRLIGYENRMLAAQDFRDDKKDAGEIGAGHTVTALYELVPPDKLAAQENPVPDTEPSEFVKAPEPDAAKPESDLSFIVRLRFKPPEGDKSTESRFPISDPQRDYANATDDFKWASSVAAFGMILRDSPHKGNATIDAVLELATAGKGDDKGGYRQEFLEILNKARTLLP